MIAGLIVENFCSLERSRSLNINVASLKMREGHPANISALLLTTNGQQLFSADQDGNVIVWRLIDGEQVKLSGGNGCFVKLTAHVHMHGAAAKMALAATGMHTRFKTSEGTDLLVGVSDDGSLCCWDLDRHVLRLRISRAHDDAISGLCIPAADMDWPGLTITASEDAVMRIWDTRPMMEIPLQSLQIDQEWAISHLRKNGLFSEMSDGDITIILHSMEMREFESLERIIWSSAEMESEDRNKQGVKEQVPKTPGSRTREKSTDVIAFVVSGIAIATADEVVIRTFRPGECLGGAGWNGFYGGGEYNGVAKSNCRCLVLHKHMYQLIAERNYGHILSTYLTDGLIESDWKDLTSQQRQGFGSILGVKDQQFLAQYDEKLGFGGSYNFATRTRTSMTNPSTSNLSSQKKASVPFAGGTMTPRENRPDGAETPSRNDESVARKTEIDSTPLSGVQKPSVQNLQFQRGSNLHTDDIPVPMTPFSVKKKKVDDGIENASSEDAEVADAGEGKSFPSPTLCAAAQLYRRKLTGENTWRLLAELKGHKEAVTCLASDDKGRLLSGSRDKTLRLWDLRKIVSSIRESQGSSTKCINIYSGLADVHTLTVITPGQESEINSYGHLSWVTDVAINNSSTLAVSISYDSTIRVWSLKEEELGHHLRTIKCARELDSMRLESLCITDDAEFAFVCGPAGVFQVWRLIDGARLSGIDWGGMCDATGEPVGDRIEFKALSISRGASIVATCRNADIVLWESGTGDGILDLVVPYASVDSSSHSFKKFAKSVITAQSTISKAVKTHRENNSAQSSEDAKPTSAGFGKKHHQHYAASVPMPTGKIIKLPGTLEEKRSESEDASAKEYYDLKLQMKDLVKDLKEEIRNECSKLKDTRLPTPVRKTSKRESATLSTRAGEAGFLCAEPNRDFKDSPVRAASPLQNADKSTVKSKKQKYGWTCRDQEALQELKDGGVVADSDSADSPTLLVMHSEALVYGKYSWSVTVKSDCSLRVGIASSERAGLPLESDLTDPNSEYWSWYLQADGSQGVELCKNFAGEYSPQEGLDFGRKGDVLEIALDCRSGQLSFDAKRGAEHFRWNFSPDSGLSRHQGAPNSDDRSVQKPLSSSEAGQEAETQSLSKALRKTPVAEDVYRQGKNEKNERRLYAFIELFGKQCDCVEISKITHESRIPAKIRTFFKEMFESLQNSKAVRPIEGSEISYKGGSVEINGRCGGSKHLDQSASTVTINWPRTALPGPTKMEVRVCPPPANSDASCDARYTAGIDKLNCGRVVGLVVDLRPHGLEFNLPITIRIPHGLVMDGDENWQNQMEGVQLDGFKDVMGVPNCLFTCFDGKFDNKYGLLTVKSSGIFGLKASSYCSDVVHAKVYCRPGPTLFKQRNSIAAHLRPSIDLKMHEVTPENCPEVFFGSSEALPMSIKFCGVFCQDEEFKDVLKAPIYYLPYRARIITMSIKEHGYALGVNLVLSPPVTKSSLMSFARSSTDDALNPDDLNMINMVYCGGPLTLNFGISAKAGKDSADLLNHPSYHLQELKVSLKLRGNISALLDQDSDAQLKQLIKQKRLQQHVSLMPFPVLVRKFPPKKKWNNAMEELNLMDSMSCALSGGLPKEGSLKQANDLQLCGDQASACDLFVIRNPSAQPNVREREIQVIV
jgi:WD40 repeat protein